MLRPAKQSWLIICNNRQNKDLRSISKQTMKENDKQLQQFFAQNKQEISDNGFSDRAIRHLPEKQRTPGLVWIFAVLSTLLVVFYRQLYPHIPCCNGHSGANLLVDITGCLLLRCSSHHTGSKHLRTQRDHLPGTFHLKIKIPGFQSAPIRFGILEY